MAPYRIEHSSKPLCGSFLCGTPPPTVVPMKTYALALIAAISLSACSTAAIEKAVEDGANSAKALAVRTTAESLGLEIQRLAVERGVPVSDPAVASEVLKRFPGVTVSDVQDGKMTVTLLDAQACLTLPTPDAEATATDGPCIQGTTA